MLDTVTIFAFVFGKKIQNEFAALTSLQSEISCWIYNCRETAQAQIRNNTKCYNCLP